MSDRRAGGELGRVLDELRSSDPWASELASTEGITWVRSALGIVGFVEILRDDLEEPAKGLAAKIEKAHALLDSLPEEKLKTEDFWNTVLVLGMPLTEAGLREDQYPALREALDATVTNLQGSRKVVKWENQDLGSIFAPLRMLGAREFRSSDPLRDELKALTTKRQAAALEILFGGPIGSKEINELVDALNAEESE